MSEAVSHINISSKSEVRSTDEIRIGGTDNNQSSESITTNRLTEVNFSNESVNPKNPTKDVLINLSDLQLPRQELFRLHEGNVIEPWKLVEDLSARLIDQYDETVVLECLIDREAKIYIETEMDISLFEGFSLEVGSLFKISKYTRTNEVRFVARSKPQLVSQGDFPKVDFQKKYGGDFFNPE